MIQPWNASSSLLLKDSPALHFCTFAFVWELADGAEKTKCLFFKLLILKGWRHKDFFTVLHSHREICRLFTQAHFNIFILELPTAQTLAASFFHVHAKYVPVFTVSVEESPKMGKKKNDCFPGVQNKMKTIKKTFERVDFLLYFIIKCTAAQTFIFTLGIVLKNTFNVCILFTEASSSGNDQCSSRWKDD